LSRVRLLLWHQGSDFPHRRTEAIQQAATLNSNNIGICSFKPVTTLETIQTYKERHANNSSQH
jgi:hypothetical protein